MLPESYFSQVNEHVRVFGMDQALRMRFDFLREQAAFGEPEVDISFYDSDIYPEGIKTEAAFLDYHDERYRSLILGHEEAILERVIRPVRAKVDGFIGVMKDLLLGYEVVPEEVALKAYRMGFDIRRRGELASLTIYPEGCCTMIRDRVDQLLNAMMQKPTLHSEIQADPAFARLKEFFGGGGRLDRIYGIVKNEEGKDSFQGALRIGMREHGIVDVAGDAFTDQREPITWNQPGAYMETIGTFERFAEVRKVHGDGSEVFAFNPGVLLSGKQAPFAFHFPILSRSLRPESELEVDAHSIGLLAKNLFKGGTLSERFLKSQPQLPPVEWGIVERMAENFQRVLEQDFDTAHADLSIFPENHRRYLEDVGLEAHKKFQTRMDLKSLDGPEAISEAFEAYQAQGLTAGFNSFNFCSSHLRSIDEAFMSAQQ